MVVSLAFGMGCQTFPTAAIVTKEPHKPVQLVTLAQSKIVEDGDDFQTVLVVQTYLLDRHMQVVEAMGNITFNVYLDGEHAHAGVKPDRQYTFSAEDAQRFRTNQDIGAGYFFELPLPVHRETKSRVLILATYQHPDGARLMSKNDLSNLPTIGKYVHTTKGSAKPVKLPAAESDSPLPTRDSPLPRTETPPTE